ncbi:MAG: ribulose-phosphate 3-epimerase [bacterium]|nr:ribulose-phosphate 3-epimerase [bacterium]
MDVTISASVLAGDPGALTWEARRAKAAAADLVHLDVMDGRFVPPISFGQETARALGEAVDLPLDVHLMVEEPWHHIASFAAAGAHLITVHAEATPHLHRLLGEIHQAGCQAGVALNPATPVGVVAHVLDLADLVLVMTVNPGYAGQTFLPGSVEKLNQLRSMLRGVSRPPRVGVDGGIDLGTAPLALGAGADFLVAGTAIFGAADPLAAVAALRRGHTPRA